MTELTTVSNVQELNPRQRLIVELTKCMKADFLNVFSKSFKTSDDLRDYRRRLYQKVKGFELCDIEDGYETYIESKPKFCPTIPELLACIESARKERLRSQNEHLEAERLASLPPPTIQCNPLQMLAEAKRSAPGAPTMEERLKSHAALLTLHSHLIKKPRFGAIHKCGVSGCAELGALSTTTKGGGNFYCREHYRQAH